MIQLGITHCWGKCGNVVPVRNGTEQRLYFSYYPAHLPNPTISHPATAVLIPAGRA